MDLKYRLLIARIKPIHQLIRVVMYNSGIFFYLKKYKANNYKCFFSKMHGSQNGKRCFIIGNGPSLSVNDLNSLLKEDCFATNEIHRIFDKTQWRPKYYLLMDRYSKTTTEELEKLEADYIFLGDYYWRYHKVNRKDVICLHQRYCLNTRKMKFSNDISQGIYISATTSYGMMQIAAYLGYSEIYLLGFDHSYTFELNKLGKVHKTDSETNHFFKDDLPEDIIANVKEMEQSYRMFKRYCDMQGIVVKNATRGGKLNVFDRIDFANLVEA